MYTIGQASARTGVSAGTLCAWERRYGIPAPARTASRYRLYDDDALAEAINGWLMPLLALLGDACDSGDTTLGAERAVSAAIMRQPGVVWDRLPEGDLAPLVLVRLPGGARHEIAPFAFATLLRANGVPVRHLGTDLPAQGWVSAVAEDRPCVVVTAVHRPTDAEPATRWTGVRAGESAGKQRRTTRHSGQRPRPTPPRSACEFGSRNTMSAPTCTNTPRISSG